MYLILHSVMYVTCTPFQGTWGKYYYELNREPMPREVGESCKTVLITKQISNTAKPRGIFYKQDDASSEVAQKLQQKRSLFNWQWCTATAQRSTGEEMQK